MSTPSAPPAQTASSLPASAAGPLDSDAAAHHERALDKALHEFLHALHSAGEGLRITLEKTLETIGQPYAGEAEMFRTDVTKSDPLLAPNQWLPVAAPSTAEAAGKHVTDLIHHAINVKERIAVAQQPGTGAEVNKEPVTKTQ